MKRPFRILTATALLLAGLFPLPLGAAAATDGAVAMELNDIPAELLLVIGLLCIGLTYVVYRKGKKND